MTRLDGLAVVVKGWPRLSETFIAQEIVALEARGWRFDIWSLRHPTDVKRHPLHQQTQAGLRYLPEYLHHESRRVARALAAARRMSGWPLAWRAFRADFRRDRTRNRLRRFGQACVLAAELGPEIRGLYAHFLHTPASVTRYAALMRGIPWAVSAHAKDIWTIDDWEKREKLAEAAFGATCTRFGAEHLQGLAPTPDRVELIYHGLDLGRFPPPPDIRPDAPPFVMLSVGRLVEKKGFDRLIAAFARLSPDFDWRWVHIGGGEMKSALAERVDQMEMTDRVEWRGPQDQTEVVAAMRAAHLFVLPSRVADDGDRDGLPNVLMEAASQKLPILSTPVGAIPEFIEHSVHGALSHDAPDALAAAIEDLAANPARRAAMAEAAYNRLAGAFGAAPGIDRLDARLRDMVT